MQGLLSLLLGDWCFEREVSAPALSMKGKGSFHRIKSDSIEYKEKGNYTWGQGAQNFFQKYLYVEKTEKLMVYKHNKTLLHCFSLPRLLKYPLMLSHVHQCKNDFYACTMTIHDSDTFCIFYSVQGLNKKYTITTSFKRKL